MSPDRPKNEIQRATDLTMPETPTDPFDGLGEASTSLPISLRDIGQLVAACATC